MQTLCYFYIFIIILFKNLEGTSDVEEEEKEHQDPRHLSRKLNPTEALAMAVNCQRQVDAHWPDKLPENENVYIDNERPRARHHHQVERRRRETPTHFLVRLPIERNNRVRRHSRQKARRKRRKRKRIDQSIMNDIIPNSEIEIDEEENELVHNNYNNNNVGQANNASDKSNQAKSQLVFTILSSIVALILAGLLLAYLYRRSRNKNECDPFFCPPEIGDNPEEFDHCTCISERIVNQSSSSRHISRPPTRRNSPPAPKKMKKTTTTTKTKRVKKTIPPPPPRLSEAELRLIQSRIACILRNDCAACQCCKCDAVTDIEQPKRSKFKLFRKKKKKIGLCNDVRCGENKIKCLTNLWSNYNSDTASSRIGGHYNNNNIHEPLLPNPCAKPAHGRERMNLRIRK